jgi:hypothetical protein
MGWTVQVLQPEEGSSSIPTQSSPGVHPAFYTMGTGSFLRVKWSGQSINHPFPSGAKVNEKYSYTCIPHPNFYGHSRVNFAFYLYPYLLSPLNEERSIFFHFSGMMVQYQPY